MSRLDVKANTGRRFELKGRFGDRLQEGVQLRSVCRQQVSTLEGLGNLESKPQVAVAAAAAAAAAAGGGGGGVDDDNDECCDYCHY